MSLTLPRRWILVLSALVAPIAFSMLSARADEPGDPALLDPESLTRFSSLDITIAQEGLPKDWKILEGEAAGPDAKALEAAVTAIAHDKGVAKSDDFHVEMRSAAAPDGAKVHYALYDLGEPSQTFVDALKAEGAKKGWSVREMGTAKHGLVTSAPEAIREKAESLATAWAAHLLTVGATGALESNGRKAVGLAFIALRLDGKSAGAHLIAGLVAKEQALRKRPLGDLGASIAHFRASLDKAATNPLSAHDLVKAQGHLGQAILNKGGPSAEARDLLKLAVAGVAEVSRDEGVGFRYDLACAHGRLKEIEEAFKLLTSVLEDDAKEPSAGISEIWRKDEDFTNLKEDPRWKKLLETYPEAVPDK